MNHPIEVGMIISEETDRWLQQKGRKNGKKKTKKKQGMLFGMIWAGSKKASNNHVKQIERLVICLRK